MVYAWAKIETCVENFIADTNIQVLLQVTTNLVPRVIKDDQQGVCQHVENIVKKLRQYFSKKHTYSLTIIQNKK
jgi:hypothetical protein